MATKRGIHPNTTIRLLKKKNPKTAGTQAFARFAAMMRVFEQTGHETLPFWRLTRWVTAWRTPDGTVRKNSSSSVTSTMILINKNVTKA